VAFKLGERWQHFQRRCWEALGHPRSGWGLAILSFSESLFFPIPPDVALMPMAAARPQKWIWLAALCTAASVLGGLLGYLVGAFLYESLGAWLLDIYDAREAFARLSELYQEWGLIIVLTAGLTPVPYKVFTIASGVMALNLPVFLLGSLLSRGLRFFVVAWLVAAFGPRLMPYIKRHAGWLSVVLILAVLGGFAVLRYI